MSKPDPAKAGSRKGVPSAKGTAIRDPETAERILELIEDGLSTTEVARIIGCTEKAIRKWAREDPDGFGRAFFMAKDLALDSMAEACIALADECPNDKNAAMAYRLRVDTRKWYLTKLAPNRYGDRLDLNHGGQGNNPVQQKLIVSWEGDD